jgi:AraC-like DNA-binding protein
MELKLSDIIGITAIIQLSGFIFFLLRKKQKLPNRLMAFFLFTQVIIYFNFLTVHLLPYTMMYAPHLLMIGEPFFWLVAPTLFLYVKSLCYSGFKLKPLHLAHLLPFVGVSAYLLFNFYFRSAGDKMSLVTGGMVFGASVRWYFHAWAFYLQFLIYNILSLVILREYRLKVKQEYASLSGKYLTWLKFVIVGFMISWLVNFTVILLMVLNRPLPFEYSFLPVFFFFVFFNIIFYKGWSQTEIFSGFEEHIKYRYSALSQKEAEKYLQHLKAYMSANKPYLDPELTLKKLSKEVGISVRHLSQLINEYLNQNFYDFISRYRIDESKRILGTTGHNKTILEVLYETGFNTKSSFNTAFKKCTGMTPTHFRETVRTENLAV